METPVGDLVDAQLPGSLGVTFANRDQDQGRFPAFFVAGKHSTPSAGWRRNVELDAAYEAGSIASFLLAPQ
jgi:hypothetical protein